MRGRGQMEGWLNGGKSRGKRAVKGREKGPKKERMCENQREHESPSIAPSFSLFHQLIAPIRQIEGGAVSQSNLWSVAITPYCNMISISSPVIVSSLGFVFLFFFLFGLFKQVTCQWFYSVKAEPGGVMCREEWHKNAETLQKWGHSYHCIYLWIHFFIYTMPLILIRHFRPLLCQHIILPSFFGYL